MRKTKTKKKRKTKVRQRPLRKRRMSVAKVFLWVLAGISVATVLTAVAFDARRYLHESDRFAVTEVDVGGVVLLTENEILSALALPARVNVFEIDEQAVAERVTALPRVRSAVVKTRIPRYMSVTIDERIPIAVAGINPKFELDRDGVILGPPRRDPTVAPLPVLTGKSFRGTSIAGAQITDAGVHEALSLCETLLADTAALPLLGSVTIDTSDATNLVMHIDGIKSEIRWGTGGYRLKLAKLLAVLNKNGGTLPFSEYVDLRQGRIIPAK